MRWWFMKRPLPSSTCPIVPLVSWLLLCPVSLSSLLSYQHTQPSSTLDVQINLVFLSLSIVLQLFCSSPKAALRYAAVRTLNKVGLNVAVSPAITWRHYGDIFSFKVMHLTNSAKTTF